MLSICKYEHCNNIIKPHKTFTVEIISHEQQHRIINKSKKGFVHPEVLSFICPKVHCLKFRYIYLMTK